MMETITYQPAQDGPETPEACRALVDSWMTLADDVWDRTTLSLIRVRSCEMLARASMMETKRIEETLSRS